MKRLLLLALVLFTLCGPVYADPAPSGSVTWLGTPGDEHFGGSVSIGAMYSKSVPVINVKHPDFGARGDAQTVSDGAIDVVANALQLTSTSASFAVSDVGKLINVAGAGAAGVPLITTIAARVDANTITLTDEASTTVTGARVVWGTDDSAAEALAFAAAATNGGVVYYPAGAYLGGRRTYGGNYITVRGAGIGRSTLILKSGADLKYAVYALNRTRPEIEDISIDINGIMQTDEPLEGTRGVEFAGCYDSKVDKVEVYHATSSGIKIYNGNTHVVSRCVMRDTDATGDLINTGGGISIGASGATTTNVSVGPDNKLTTGLIEIRAAGGTTSSQIRVFDNVLKDIINKTSASYITAANTTGLGITGNKVTLAATGSSNVAGINVVDCYDVDVSGNPIDAHAIASGSTGISILTSQSVSVTSNPIYGGQCGIKMDTSTGVVSLNALRSQPLQGVYIYNSLGVVVSVNRIYGSWYGVDEGGTSNYTLISGNSFNTHPVQAIRTVGANTVSDNNMIVP